MARRAKWVSSILTGLVMGWLAGSTLAQQAAPQPDADANQAADSGRAVQYTASRGYTGGFDHDDNEETLIPEPATEIIKERFANGSVKIEREVTQDAQGNYINHGVWKMWDQQGNLVAQGNYRHGHRTGEWIRWYRSVTDADMLAKPPYQLFVGPFVSQATFENGQLHGAWTIFDSKTRKISQFKFTDGRRDGDSTWWFPSGRTLRQIQYHDGEIDGTFIEWNADGAVTTKDTYQAGRKLGQKTAHHNGGAKKSEGMYLFAKQVEQTPDDWWACKPMTITKTGKDEKHGPWASWYPGGQKQQEGNYEHDVQIGKFVWWFANGQKSLEGIYEDGQQDGPWVWWFDSGQKKIQGEYSNGNPTGRWTWWNEDGKVAKSADLSHTEGIVIDTPKQLDPAALPRASKPLPKQPVKR